MCAYKNTFKILITYLFLEEVTETNNLPENIDSISNNQVTGMSAENNIRVLQGYNETLSTSLNDLPISFLELRNPQERNRLYEPLRMWALRHNITHHALKDLLILIKQQYGDKHLPGDPRTLLETPRNTTKLCLPIGGGKYWHHGIRACLEQWFQDLSADIVISININIDGLPIHKSSKFQLWPILCNIHEFPELPALPIGIFFGKSKPTDVNEFLTPFVDEIIPLLQAGVVINYHTIAITLRCFICDSPARAFIKGMQETLINNVVYFRQNITSSSPPLIFVCMTTISHNVSNPSLCAD